MSRKSGFVLIDFLISLGILVMLVPIVVMILQIMQRTLMFDETVQDTIASIQLRKILLSSYDIETDGRTIFFTYEDREMECFYRNHHLVITPGTQIFYTDIDEAYFIEEEDCIEIYYMRKDVVYHEVLLHK